MEQQIELDWASKIMADLTDINPSERYATLEVDRKGYEDRAKTLAQYTIPSLYADDSANENSSLLDSYGSRYAGILINSLANRTALALFPPSGSPFKLTPDKDALLELTQGNAQARSAVMGEIGSVTSRVNEELNRQTIRPVLPSILSNIIAVAPVVVEKIEGKGIRYHSLRNFVVKLDSMGEPLEYIIKEEIDPVELPEGMNPEDYEGEEDLELYTMCWRDQDKWYSKQSIGSEEIGDISTYDLDALPYTYLGWTLQHGDKYHRPLAESVQGVLNDYESINRVVVQGSIIAAKVIVMVDPLGTTEKSDVADSANGDVIDGREGDVTTMKTNKNYDFQTALAKEDKLKQQLDQAFMSRQGTQRDAERVTAEEVRRDAKELDENMAGMYSVLSAKLTKWLITHIMKELNIKFDAIEVNVITGLDALGRSIESQKLDAYVGRMVNLEMKDRLKDGELAIRYAAYEGIDTEGLLKTDEEVSAERQAQQEAMAKQQLLESGAQSLGQTAGARAGENMGGQ